MIIDQSHRFSGQSCSRLDTYLSRCKIDLLIRPTSSNVDMCVNHPDNAGHYVTKAQTTHKVADQKVWIKVNHNLKSGNRSFTLNLKKEISNQYGIQISSLTEAGSVILGKGNMDYEKLILYDIETSQVPTTLRIAQKKWSFCLVSNKQETWVHGFLSLYSESQVTGIQQLAVVNQGKIYLFNTSKSNRR